METEEQLAHLKDLECAYGKGFLFSYPNTAAATEKLICQIVEAPVRDQVETAA